MSEASANLNRRQFLSTTAVVAGIAAGAGCTALWDQPGASDVIVYNASDGTRTVLVTITGSDAEQPHTSRTVTIPEGEKSESVNESKIPLNSSYTVEVSVDDGASEQFEWEDPDVELAPLYVVVDGTRNVKFLLQAG